MCSTDCIRVLLIEKQKDVVQRQLKFLRQFCENTIYFTSTSNVSDFLRRCSEINVIVLNLTRAIDCGKELVEYIKEEIGVKLPVLVVSGTEIVRDKECLEQNNIIVIQAPIDLEEFKNSVIRLASIGNK